MSTADYAPTPSERASGGEGALRVWPLRKPALWTLAKGGVLMLVIWSAAGMLFVEFLDNGPVGDADRAGAEWLEEHRTKAWNTVTNYGSMMSETLVKVTLVVIVGGAMVVVWRRWHDGVFLAVVVSLESTVFVISSFIVGRERPPVEQLDDPAPSGSFPSGHSAAAVAFYASLFIIVRWHTRNGAVRLPFSVVAVAIPIIVAISRAARGMHYPIDVVAGLMLGVASIFVTRAALAAGVDEIRRETAQEDCVGGRAPLVPQRARRLDLNGPDPGPAAPLTE